MTAMKLNQNLDCQVSSDSRKIKYEASFKHESPPEFKPCHNQRRYRPDAQTYQLRQYLTKIAQSYPVEEQRLQSLIELRQRQHVCNDLQPLRENTGREKDPTEDNKRYLRNTQDAVKSFQGWTYGCNSEANSMKCDCP